MWSEIIDLVSSLFFLHVEINSHYVKNIATFSMVYLGCKVRKYSSDVHHHHYNSYQLLKINHFKVIE